MAEPQNVQTLGRCLTAHEASDFLGISIHTLRNWTSQRKIPSVSYGGQRVVYLKPDLEAFIQAHRREAI